MSRLIGQDGRFRTLQEIDEGGFANVFLAEDQVTGRRVAVKVLKDAERLDEQVVERFRREVYAISSVSSPHVVSLYDFGLSGAELYIAMELVEGATLRQVIYDREWKAAEVHVLVGQIAQALAAAHRRGVVHRDLKPENIKLALDGDGQEHVKVLDFGFAKLLELERELGGAPLTLRGSCFGTPQYMAPEQIRDRGQGTTAQIDLFALGIIAYEVLAKERPFGGADPVEVMHNVLKAPLPPIARFHPSVTRGDEVNRFLARALEKDRARRPADAAEFFSEFELALLGAHPPPRAGLLIAPEDAAFCSVLRGALTDGSNYAADTLVIGPALIAEMARAAAAHGAVEHLPSGWFDPHASAAGPALAEDDSTTHPNDARGISRHSTVSPAALDEGVTLRDAPVAAPRKKAAIVGALIVLALGLGYLIGWIAH